MRWRDRPRRTLRRWDLDQGYLLYAGLAFAGWLIGVEYLVDAVLGRRDASGSDWRLGTALFGLATLAAGAGLTWFAVLYLRRPVRREDEPRDTAPTPDDVRLRNDAEESARRYR